MKTGCTRALLTVVCMGLALASAHAQTGQKGEQQPKAEELVIRPYVQYKVAYEAVVSWITSVPSPSILHYGTGEAELTRVADMTPKMQHSFTLTGLDYETVYIYNVTTAKGGKETVSIDYTFDTTFNYAFEKIADGLMDYPDAETEKRIVDAAEYILKTTGITQGYCIVYGLGDGYLAYELAKRSDLVIHGVDDNPQRVDATRERLRKAKLYGNRISVRTVESLDEIPFTSRFANLVVSETLLTEENWSGGIHEPGRVVRPSGGQVILGIPQQAKTSVSQITPIQNASWVAESSLNTLNEGVNWNRYVAAALPSTGSWSHQYGNPANTANSGDTLGGAGTTGEMETQWVGRPGADFGIDRNPRMPAPLSINGRLFHQGLNRATGIDMYNGALLWMAEIPGLRRVNIPRDVANWCVDNDVVYTAIEDKCWLLDAATGDLEYLINLPAPATSATHEWGYVAQVDDLFYGSSVRKGSSYTDYWGNDAWYDKTSGPGTFNVCSDRIFALDKATRTEQWGYSKGRILNPTISIGDGMMYFVESRNPKVLEQETGRIEMMEIWQDQYLVALDAKTGEMKWETPIDTEDGVVIFYLTYTDGMLAINSSRDGTYYIYGFDASNGEQKWAANHPWPSNNHGAHMQHPAIVGNIAFLEPMGYDTHTGEVLVDNMGRREGCATVAATSDALIYRGQNRQVAMWDIASGEVSSWLNLRPSCWLSVVPSGGMILAPEGGGGCSCGSWVETSLGFIPGISIGTQSDLGSE